MLNAATAEAHPVRCRIRRDIPVRLSLAFGGDENARPWPTAFEWAGLACFPIGVVVGLATGFRRELPGGLIAIGSLAGFYLWNFAASRSLAAGPWFLLLTASARLFVLSDRLDAIPRGGSA